MSRIYETEKADKNVQFTFVDKGQYDTFEGDEIIVPFSEDFEKDQLTIPLSMDLDIFDIFHDKRVQSKERVKCFLESLRMSIKRLLEVENLGNIYLNKLSIEEQKDESELMVDWIFNYFRVFYSFDDKEGDMYGMIVNDTERLDFLSEFKQLKESDYDKVAEKTVSFVLEHIKK